MTRNKKLTIALAILVPVLVLGTGMVAATSTPELVIPDTSSRATYTAAAVSSDSTAAPASPCDDCTGDCSGNGACDGDCDGECAGSCDRDCSGTCASSGNCDEDCSGSGNCDGDCAGDCAGTGKCDGTGCGKSVTVTSPCGSPVKQAGGCGGSCSR